MAESTSSDHGWLNRFDILVLRAVSSWGWVKSDGSKAQTRFDRVQISLEIKLSARSEKHSGDSKVHWTEANGTSEVPKKS